MLEINVILNFLPSNACFRIPLNEHSPKELNFVGELSEFSVCV